MAVKADDRTFLEHGMKRARLMVALLIAATSATTAAAQLYQWKDAQGRMVYSDQAPPPSVKNAQKKSFKGSVIEGSESYAARTAREKHPVTLYASACGTPCDQARQLLNERGIPFSSKDPQISPEAQGELRKLIGQLRVPVLVVGTDKISGFESGQWHGALDRAGYPKSAPPGSKPAPPAQAPAPETDTAP